jgi:hypothetical protein
VIDLGLLYLGSLESADQVARLMARASGRRAVAATMMNERSSRSHSVFSLKVRGYNPLTSETCEVSSTVFVLSSRTVLI